MKRWLNPYIVVIAAVILIVVPIGLLVIIELNNPPAQTIISNAGR